MNCKRYSSKESYYGVAGDVPVMTGSFIECEPESDEEVRESFLEWMDENGEILEPDFPTNVFLYCDICEEDIEWNATPKEYFSNEELYEINKSKAKEWLEKGEIDEEDYKYLLEDLEKIFKK